MRGVGARAHDAAVLEHRQRVGTPAAASVALAGSNRAFQRERTHGGAAGASGVLHAVVVVGTARGGPGRLRLESIGVVRHRERLQRTHAEVRDGVRDEQEVQDAGAVVARAGRQRATDLPVAAPALRAAPAIPPAALDRDRVVALVLPLRVVRQA